MIKRLLQEHKIISLLIKKYKINNYSYGYVKEDILSIAAKNERLLGKIYKKGYINLCNGILSDFDLVLSKEFLFNYCSCQEGVEYIKNREGNIFTSEQVDEYLKHFLSNEDLDTLTSVAITMGEMHGKVIIDSVLKLSITQCDLSNLKLIVKNCKMFPPELVDLYISVCDNWAMYTLINVLKNSVLEWTWNLSDEERTIALKMAEDARLKLIENEKIKKERKKQRKKEASLTEEQKEKIADKKIIQEEKDKRLREKRLERVDKKRNKELAYKENLANALQEEINSL